MAPTDEAEALEPYLQLWQLSFREPAIRTATALVLKVWRDDQSLMLKLVLNPDEAGQREALAHFAGRGAVRLVEWDGAAMLLERAVPGTPLARLTLQGRDEEAAEATCRVIAQLLSEPPPAESELPTVEDWGGAFDRVGRVAEQRGVQPRLLERAQRLYADLAETQGPRLLLHGDLQHYNILLDETRGWLAIDPKGVLGEAAFEIGAWLRNPEGEMRFFADTAIVARRAAMFAERLGLDRQRVLGWAFCQAVLSALWSIEDGGEPGQALSVARATLPLL